MIRQATALIRLALVFLVHGAIAQTLRVQVLNGKTGKPVENEHVNLFRGEGSFADLSGNTDVAGFVTDARGIISTSKIDSTSRTVWVSVDWHRYCSGAKPVFTLSQIFSAGIVSANACKPRIRAVAEPGTLIFFVRDETFFEKMAH
jgi:hypothetical protein